MYSSLNNHCIHQLKDYS